MATFDHTESYITPAESAVPHVLGDEEIRRVPKAIWVGVGGDITMRGTEDNEDTLWIGVPSGTVIPFRPKFIRATGTTAASILLLY